MILALMFSLHAQAQTLATVGNACNVIAYDLTVRHQPHDVRLSLPHPGYGRRPSAGWPTLQSGGGVMANDGEEKTTTQRRPLADKVDVFVRRVVGRLGMLHKGVLKASHMGDASKTGRSSLYDRHRAIKVVESGPAGVHYLTRPQVEMPPYWLV